MTWALRVITGLMVLVLGAVAVFFLLPAERIAGLVAEQFEAATGRAMTLQGDVRPTLWPELGVNTGAVRVANADWADAAPMLTAARLSVGVDIGALLRGEIRVRRVEIEAPRIRLERAADGRGNWERAAIGADGGGDPGAAADGGDPLPAFSLDEARISDGQLVFIDRAAGSRTELDVIDATIRLPDLRGAGELTLSAQMNGQRFDLDGRVAAFADFLSQGAVPVAASLTAGGSRIAFDGRAGIRPAAAGGRLDADLRDLPALFGLLGLAPPDLPPGLGRQRAVQGDVTLTGDGAATLRNGTIRLDQNSLTGAVDLALADRPRLTARLVAGALDFSALTGGGGDAPAAAADAAPAGWSRARIDVGALQSLDAEIALQAESLDLGLARFGPTRTLTRLDAGRAVTEIRELAAYGGGVAGSVVVNSRGGLSARANLTGNSLALQPLLQALAGYDRLLAAGDVTVNLLAVGDDMASLMASLSGDGSVRLGKGELRGLDLVGMLRNLDTSFVGDGARTIFDAISASFTVEGGVLRNDDLRLVAPLLTAEGAGAVGIGAQTLDYRLAPALLAGQANAGLKVPLLITGPWADPKFRLDLASLAEQELADDVEQLKDKAEEAVKQKLEEELGVAVEDLGDVEDALKQELEDRLREGVMDFLSGD